MARPQSSNPKNPTANLGFEAKLWLAANKLRNNMDAAEYKHRLGELIDLIAGFVLANGSMSSNQSGEGDIRRAIVEADLVDCMAIKANLRGLGYPPDLQEEAVKTVLMQAELLCADWTAA